MAVAEPKNDQPKEPTIDGITRVEFNSWKQSPVTQAYLKYLKEQAYDTKMAVMDGWAGGKIDLAGADEMRGRHNTFLLAAKPNFDAITTFYEERDAMKKEIERNDRDDSD